MKSEARPPIELSAADFSAGWKDFHLLKEDFPTAFAMSGRRPGAEVYKTGEKITHFFHKAGGNERENVILWKGWPVSLGCFEKRTGPALS